ncbi:hypothetical protein Poly21_54010 [Allorhodopirellula heiligendammensis]|uniref:Uncharacterized protein n=2 Tax=Allorhodopirellula heiligendammensis TaxID=2714739 RepID=A0A5C6BHC1_9BACT|nr:hypothetical protein Poly21_54010 [Allorhodopirellula heiligendammensis]
MNVAMNSQSRRMNAGPTAGALLAIALSSSLAMPVSVTAQVRTKLPDRATYNPAGPSTPPSQPMGASDEAQVAGVTDESIAASLRQSPLREADGKIEPVNLRPLPSMVPRGKARVLALADDRGSDPPAEPPQSATLRPASYVQPRKVQSSSNQIQTPAQRRVVGYDSQQHIRRTASPGPQTLIQHGQSEEWIEGGVIGSGSTQWAHDGNMGPIRMGNYSGCNACDGGGCNSCDSWGGDCNSCDGLGCDGCGQCRDFSNASLSFDPCRWFGSIELLLLFREGDSIPALVTTSPTGTTADTAGQLPGATILAGGEQAFKDLTAGGRLTIGTWLDDQRNRSLVFRGWTATEADLSFSAREGINAGPILAIPTTNAGAADAVLIAYPNSNENFGRFGSVNLSADSNVYGGDISVRQFLTGGLGTTFDVLYGYQYMGLDENLQLSTSSTKTQDQFPDQVGNNLSTFDQFEASNQFHGGQFGFAGAYREGCWSFDWLGKVGFGQIKRQAERHGRSVITTDTPPPAVNDTGLLVSDANTGSYSSSTFGWAPEFDLSVGWHKYPRFDVTFGYNIIAMTDAVRLSGIMDPTNTLDTPRSSVNYGTFMVQGIHFGIRHVW